MPCLRCFLSFFLSREKRRHLEQKGKAGVFVLCQSENSRLLFFLSLLIDCFSFALGLFNSFFFFCYQTQLLFLFRLFFIVYLLIASLTEWQNVSTSSKRKQPTGFTKIHNKNTLRSLRSFVDDALGVRTESVHSQTNTS